MSSGDLIKRISNLLKQHYPPTCAETKGFKLRKHAKLIAELIEDPLLWLRLTCDESAIKKLDQLQKLLLRDKEEVVEKRLEVLQEYSLACEEPPDLARLTDWNGEHRRKLFATALENVVVQSVTIKAGNEDTAAFSQPLLEGVVVDMYAESGYVCLPPPSDIKLAQVYKFDSTALVNPGCMDLPLYIGDTVLFKMPARCSDHIDNSTLSVVRYFRPDALSEEFILKYLEQLAPSLKSPVTLSTETLQSPALWNVMLNEPCVYQKFYQKILVACSSTEAGSDNAEKQIFLNTLVGCSFLQEIASLLQQDKRQNHPEETPEFQAYVSVVRTVITLLTTIVRYLPNEAYKITAPLKHFIELPELLVEQKTKPLAFALVDVYLTPAMSSPECPQQPPSPNEKHPTALSAPDPLLWVRQIYDNSLIDKAALLQALCKIRLADHEEVVIRRMKVLGCSVANEKDSTRPPNEDRQSRQQPAGDHRNYVLHSVNVQGAEDESMDEPWGPTQPGVIVDIYPQEGSCWEGYIVSLPHKDSTCQPRIYRFDSTIKTKADDDMVPLLHIGDAVTFKVSHQNKVQIANGTLKVMRYFPGVLPEEYASRFMNRINQSGADAVQVLQMILASPATWKAILNEPRLYPKFLYEILAIYTTCSTGDMMATPDAMQIFMDTFKGCPFIQALPTLLDQNSSPSQASEHGTNILCTATQLFIDFFKYLPTEGHQIAKEIKSMVELLSKHAKHDEVQSLACALVECYVIPPPSLKVKELPWKSIPTIPTKQEFEDRVQALLQQPASIIRYDPTSLELPVVKFRGRYESLDEYGRTYYTLLRADCYGNLIEVVAHLKTKGIDGIQGSFYYATFTGLTLGTGRRIVYSFFFVTPPLARSGGRTDDSQLMKDGNLLCISIGGRFENDLVWATVDSIKEVSSTAVDQEGEEMFQKQAIVCVQLCSDANDQPDERVMELLKQSKNMVAVESPAYYRAYQPILDALRGMDLEKIHFKEDLLDPDKQVQSAPAIVDDDSSIDPTIVYFPSEHPNLPSRMTVGELKQALESDHDSNKFCLDRSQREAFYHALSYPLTVIQGPPGTGKTYMALKLLQLFLSLSTLPKGKPIIVMAYKNRALDHFLQQSMAFCRSESIVRLGHVSEGYKDTLVGDMLLFKRVQQTFSRGSTLGHLQRLRVLYGRVVSANKELEMWSRPTLDKNRALDLISMTPQWLRSLLEGQERLSPMMKQRLTHSPQECLDLLQTTSVMGSQDTKEKDILQKALRAAWSDWTMEVQLDLVTTPTAPSKTKRRARFSLSEDTDAEEDDIQIKQDRHMARDDIEDDTAQETLLDVHVTRFNIQTTDVPDIDDSNVWALSPEERKQLIQGTILRGYQEAVENMKEALKDYNEAHQRYEWERQAQCLRVLRKAKVVGMTTTGAAIHQRLLNQLKAAVVFVEEAAEVLESNLLATLTPHVKHMVLIGDHKQLKPSIACPELKRHRFNVSMFERLVNNNFPHTLLMRQSRMRRDLVPLFSYHYTEQMKEAASRLLSAKKVDELSHPSCMSTSFFWWSYSEEREMKCGTQITNPHEVKMVVALCVWLLSQREEESHTISVLTPYRAQLQLIQDELKVKANQLTFRQVPQQVLVGLTKIPVHTIDEFQGHESDIVILSLVRSNTGGKIGFLKEKNRLVVGTSRQKRGLYIVGDADFLKLNSQIVWKKFIERLDEKSIGKAIPIKCQMEQRKCLNPDELEAAAINPDPLTQKNKTDGAEANASVPQLEVLRQHSSPAALSSPAAGQGQNASKEKRNRDLWMELQIANGVAKEWRNIARHLDLDDTEIDDLEARYKSEIKEAFYQMMRKWNQNKGKEATLEKLAKALDKVGLVHAREIVDKYNM